MTGEIVAIPIKDPQLPTDYYVVRVELVHVKKGFFGLKDKRICYSALLPNTRKEAAEVFIGIQKDFTKRGVTI